MSNVNIEGTDHEWGGGAITTADIRRLGGMPDGTEIIEVDGEDNTERTVGDSEHIDMHEGKEYGKKVKFRRG